MLSARKLLNTATDRWPTEANLSSTVISKVVKVYRKFFFTRATQCSAELTNLHPVNFPNYLNFYTVDGNNRDKCITKHLFTPKCIKPSSIDFIERESHARGVYPEQDTSTLKHHR